MKTIIIPRRLIAAALGPPKGTWVEHAVCVNWPELKLTEAQLVANAIALANEQETPFPDPSLIRLIMPYINLTIDAEASIVSSSPTKE